MSVWGGIRGASRFFNPGISSLGGATMARSNRSLTRRAAAARRCRHARRGNLAFGIEALEQRRLLAIDALTPAQTAALLRGVEEIGRAHV